MATFGYGDRVKVFWGTKWIDAVFLSYSKDDLNVPTRVTGLKVRISPRVTIVVPWNQIMHRTR